ncbi:MAG TPA: cytochrome P450 [Chloroflexota bacterium]|nr:cytochrome P450 [Chloroflexota bacterium]
MTAAQSLSEFAPENPAFIADPYPAYERLRDRGRVHWYEPSRQWLIPHYEDVNRLLRDRRLGRTYLHRFSHEKFGRAAPPLDHEPFHVLNGNGILDLEAPDHTRIRRLVSKAFTPRTIEQLAPTVERLAAGLVDELLAAGGGDLLMMVAEPLPVAVIAEMLGVPVSDRHLLRPWSAAICRMFELNPDENAARGAVRASIEFSAYLRALIDERRSAPGEDLISALIAAHEEGDRLTEQEMISTCVLLLNAGHEATVNATTTGWWTLFRHPDQLEQLRGMPRTIPNAIEELLRFDTPLQMFERWVLDDVEIDGTLMPRGSEIALLFGSANRDPGRFPDPDRLDLTRSDNRHMSFGAGIHFCLGAPLARIELAASFGELMRRAPTLRLVREPEWKSGYVIRGLKELLVEV